MKIPLVRAGRTLTARENNLVRATACAIIIAAFYVYLIEPRIRAWMTLEADLRDALREYHKLSVVVEHEEEIENRYSRLKKTFESKGSESADAIHFYEFLGSVDAGDSFRVRDIRPVLTRNTDARLRTTQVVVFCEGTVDGLEQFLRKIASSEQALSIEKLSFSMPRMNAPLKITATVSKTVKRDS